MPFSPLHQQVFLVQSALLGWLWGLPAAKELSRYGAMALWRYGTMALWR